MDAELPSRLWFAVMDGGGIQCPVLTWVVGLSSGLRTRQEGEMSWSHAWHEEQDGEVPLPGDHHYHVDKRGKWSITCHEDGCFDLEESHDSYSTHDPEVHGSLVLQGQWRKWGSWNAVLWRWPLPGSFRRRATALLLACRHYGVPRDVTNLIMDRVAKEELRIEMLFCVTVESSAMTRDGK